MLTAQPSLTPLTLWHLLSLDAPSVAVVWLCFVARVTHTPLPPTLPIAMFLAVWLLYAADRLLDAHPFTPSLTWLTQIPARPYGALLGAAPSLHLQARHRFHSTHRRPFAFALLLAAFVLGAIVPTLPQVLLHSYVLLAVMFASWFALIHLTSLSLPKEFAPGLFFVAAVFIPIPHAPFSATCLAALCTMNCLYIHCWEHPADSRLPHDHGSLTLVRAGLGRRPAALDSHPVTHPVTLLAIRHLPALTLAVAVFALSTPRPIAIAGITSSMALLALDHLRHRLSPTNLRAAADLALLTPALILPFLP